VRVVPHPSAKSGKPLYNGGRKGVSVMALSVIAILILLLAVLIGSLFILGMFAANQSHNLSHSVSANSTQVDGVQLMGSINATIIGQGQAIGVEAMLFNTLDHNVTLIPGFDAYSNVTDWGSYSNNDCTNHLPVDFAIFEGYYSAQNVSLAGEPLLVAEPFPIPIPCIDFTPATSYTMLPDSTMAQVIINVTGQMRSYSENMMFGLAPFQVPPCFGKEQCSGGINVGAKGYWTGTGENYVFHLFPKGDYTVAIADVWGQLLIFHFQVV